MKSIARSTFSADFSAELALRNRLDRINPPVAINLNSLEDLQELVRANEIDVHELKFSIHEEVKKVKLSYISKINKFNIHCGKKNVFCDSISKKEIIEHFSEELGAKFISEIEKL